MASACGSLMTSYIFYINLAYKAENTILKEGTQAAFCLDYVCLPWPNITITLEWPPQSFIFSLYVIQNLLNFRVHSIFLYVRFHWPVMWLTASVTIYCNVLGLSLVQICVNLTTSHAEVIKLALRDRLNAFHIQLPSRHFWDRHGWKSGLSIVMWDCGRWKSGPFLLGSVSTITIW